MFEECCWKNLYIGDIIKVSKNEILPADIVVIKSTNESGFCYLQTTNLDGESTLKPREALIPISNLIKDDNAIADLKFIIEVDHPDNHIYACEGTIILDKKYNFDIKNVLLRVSLLLKFIYIKFLKGCTLKNVDYVYGIIVYTGKETKLMQNIHSSNTKVSYIDESLNKIILYIIIVMFLICAICTAF